MSLIKEDMAGLLNKYCVFFDNIQNGYDVRSEEKALNEEGPLEVFLVNQAHFSNCFLLISDHLNDNVSANCRIKI